MKGMGYDIEKDIEQKEAALTDLCNTFEALHRDCDTWDSYAAARVAIKNAKKGEW